MEPTGKIQQLHDEINRVKGEDGKAKIKANGNGSYSTEKERKEAAPSSPPPAIGFRLTKYKLETMGKKQVPGNVLKPLAGIKNKNFSSEDEFWTYYGKLREYQKNPRAAKIKKLEKEFDELFSTQTGYPELDERIEKIENKKKELVTVLKYPEIPLHNNTTH